MKNATRPEGAWHFFIPSPRSHPAARARKQPEWPDYFAALAGVAPPMAVVPVVAGLVWLLLSGTVPPVAPGVPVAPAVPVVPEDMPEVDDVEEDEEPMEPDELPPIGALLAELLVSGVVVVVVDGVIGVVLLDEGVLDDGTAVSSTFLLQAPSASSAESASVVAATDFILDVIISCVLLEWSYEWAFQLV